MNNMKSKGKNCRKAHDVLNHHVNYSQALIQFKPQHSFIFFKKCSVTKLLPFQLELDYQRRALTWLNWFSQKVLQGIYFCFHVWRTSVKVKALSITSMPFPLVYKNRNPLISFRPNQSSPTGSPEGF